MSGSLAQQNTLRYHPPEETRTELILEDEITAAPVRMEGAESVLTRTLVDPGDGSDGTIISLRRSHRPGPAEHDDRTNIAPQGISRGLYRITNLIELALIVAAGVLVLPYHL